MTVPPHRAAIERSGRGHVGAQALRGTGAPMQGRNRPPRGWKLDATGVLLLGALACTALSIAGVSFFVGGGERLTILIAALAGGLAAWWWWREDVRRREAADAAADDRVREAQEEAQRARGGP